jgi:hypothetical protein
MTSEKPKSPFIAEAVITTQNKTGEPYVMKQTVRADTIEGLRAQIGGVEAVTRGQGEETGKIVTVKFGPTMQLNPETGEYGPLQEAKKKRGLLARIFSHTSEVIPSVLPDDK